MIQNLLGKADSQLIVLLNDANSISKGIEDGFSNYDVNTIRWSERSKAKKYGTFNCLTKPPLSTQGQSTLTI